MYLHYIILAALILCFAAVCIGEHHYEQRRAQKVRKPNKPALPAVHPDIPMISHSQYQRLASLACPYCENDLAISFLHDGTLDVPAKGYHVYCPRCSFSTPLTKNEETAIRCAEQFVSRGKSISCDGKASGSAPTDKHSNRTDGYNPMFSCIDHGDSVTMVYNGKEDAANGTLHE